MTLLYEDEKLSSYHSNRKLTIEKNPMKFLDTKIIQAWIVKSLNHKLQKTWSILENFYKLNVSSSVLRLKQHFF